MTVTKGVRAKAVMMVSNKEHHEGKGRGLSHSMHNPINELNEPVGAIPT